VISTSRIWRAKELFGLQFALEHELQELEKILLIWTTDSQTAFYAVNKGSSSSEQCRTVLSAIFSLCDVKKIFLLALWLPREENTHADFLSHLATLSHRPYIAAHVSDLRSPPPFGENNI